MIIKNAGQHTDGSSGYDDLYYVHVIQIKNGVCYAPVYLYSVKAPIMKIVSGNDNIYTKQRLNGQLGHGVFDCKEMYEFKMHKLIK